MDDILNGRVPDNGLDRKIDMDIGRTQTAEEILAELKGRSVSPTDERSQQPMEDISSHSPIEEPFIEIETSDSKLASEDVADAEKQETPPAGVPSESLSAVLSGIEGVERNVNILTESSVKIAGEVREMHKLYHNEYATRLKAMQDELERYREIDKGRIFDGILGEVAKLYSDYESVIEDITEEKAKKRIRYLLEDIVQILEANGVFRQKSNHGDKRNTRHCQVIERIPTNNPALHDVVAQSRGTGFYVENRSLIKEPVDIYLYSETTDDKSAQI
jgi:hypothetical protein